MFSLKRIFGGSPTLYGAPIVATLPLLEIYVEGFDVALSTTAKAGEYTVSVQSNGKNPKYPAEDRAKEIHLTKSPDQFNLAKTPLGRIAHDQNYSRIVIAVVPPAARQNDFGMVELNHPKPELCVLAYIRGKNGVEQLWSGMGIECLMAPRPRTETRDLKAA